MDCVAVCSGVGMYDKELDCERVMSFVELFRNGFCDSVFVSNCPEIEDTGMNGLDDCVDLCNCVGDSVRMKVDGWFCRGFMVWEFVWG